MGNGPHLYSSAALLWGTALGTFSVSLRDHAQGPLCVGLHLGRGVHPVEVSRCGFKRSSAAADRLNHWKTDVFIVGRGD